MRNRTLKDIKDELYYKNPNILILEDEYINAHHKMKCKCLLDNHVWYAKWNNLQQGKGCPKCSGSLRVEESEIIKILSETHSNLEVIEYTNTSENIKVRCKNDGYIWNVKWGNLRNGRQCPKCKNRIRNYNMDMVKKELHEINKDIILLSKIFKDSSGILKFKCTKDNHEFHRSWSKFKQNPTCPRCSKKIFDIEDYIDEMHLLNKDIEILSKEYRGVMDKIECKCKCDGYEFKRFAFDLLKNPTCPVCNGKRYFNNIYDCKEYLLSINKDIRLISLKFNGFSKPHRFKCVKCGYIWSTKWHNIEGGCGCPNCAGLVKYTLEDVKNFIIENNLPMELISKDYKDTNTPLEFKCLKCNDIFTTTFSYLRIRKGCIGEKCKNKSSSLGEIYVKDKLLENGISIISQHKFKDCIYKYPLIFDFYSTDYNFCIEFQGKQHYEPIKYFGGLEAFESQCVRDNIKRQYCIDNNIVLFEIPYYDDIDIYFNEKILPYIDKFDNEKDVVNG